MRTVLNARTIQDHVPAIGRYTFNPPLVLAGRKGWLYQPVFARVCQLGLENLVHFSDWVDETEFATYPREPFHGWAVERQNIHETEELQKAAFILSWIAAVIDPLVNLAKSNDASGQSLFAQAGNQICRLPFR